ncbi:MAG: hypothetical protein ACKVS9_20260 [Phycisphaerae bacterium]
MSPSNEQGLPKGIGTEAKRSPLVQGAIDACKFLLALAFTVVAFGAMNWFLAECWHEKYGNSNSTQHGCPSEVKPAVAEGVSMLVPLEASHGVMHRRG